MANCIFCAKVLLLCTGLFGLSCAQGVNTFINAAITIGRSIFSLMTGGLGGETVTIEEIQKLIDASTESIKEYISLEEQLSELRKLEQTVDSLMSDLMRIMKSKDNVTKSENIGRYKTQYETNKVAFAGLEKFLTGSGPLGLRKAFLKAVSDHVKCDVPSLETVEQYFMQLAKSGMILEVAYEATTSAPQFDTVKDEWIGMMHTIRTLFSYQINVCQNKAPNSSPTIKTQIADVSYIVFAFMIGKLLN